MHFSVLYCSNEEAVVAENKPKLPKSGGAKKALESIKKFRNQQPSDRLVKITSEYGQNVKKPGVAAKKDVEI